MKKIFTSIAVGLALLVGSSSANAVTQAAMPVDGSTFEISNSTVYTYTPASNGVLSITTSANPTFLWSSWDAAGDEPVESSAVSYSDQVGDQPPFTYTFKVTQGVTYYAYVYFGSGESTAKFEAGSSSGDEDKYADFVDMVMNNEYTPSTANPVKLKYTAPSDGKLTVLQKGNYDSCLFSGLPSSASDYGSVIPTDGGTYSGTPSTGYTLVYSLSKGQTVYFIAPNVVMGTVSSVTFSWAGVNTDGIPEAEMNVAFNPYNKLYQFTPEETGVMTIYYSRYSFSMLGGGNSPVYTNATHSAKLAPIAGDDYDTGYEATYQVEKGKTIYFYNGETDAKDITFTITGLIKKDPAIILNLTQLYPQPGDASWNENIANYGSGFQYLFTPANVNIKSATVSYVDQNDQSQSVTFDSANESQMEYMGGGWIVRLYDTLAAIKANGKGNTYFTVTLNNVTYNGNKMNIEYDEVTDAAQYVSVNNDAGSVSFQYFIAAQEMALVSDLSEWPETIYETWEEGDINGKAILVFTNPIKELNEATITLGNQTWGSVSGGDDPDPSGNIPYEINNNILTLDFTKVQFDRAATKTYTTCTVFITGVTDIYGQGMGIPSVDQKITYSATEAENPVISMENGMILKPEGNNYALALDAFEVQWAEENLTAVPNKTLEAILYIDNVMKGKVPVTITQGELTEQNDVISIDLTQYKGQYGAYLVSIPAGIVQNEEGHVNPAQMVSCYIFETDDDYVITPIPGTLETLDEDIKVTFTGSALALNQDAGAVLWANNRIPVSVSYDSLVIPMSDIAAGTYTLVVPPTLLIIDNQFLNDTITAEYVVLTTGVDGLIDADENGAYNVYNMNGVKVASGDANVVKNLNKGLYIINGKKVIVK